MKSNYWISNRTISAIIAFFMACSIFLIPGANATNHVNALSEDTQIEVYNDNAKKVSTFSYPPGTELITVNFNTNGGSAVSPAAIKVGKGYTIGSAISQLPTPTARTGYTFNGWYTDKTSGSQISLSTIISSSTSVTYYARWIPNSYKVVLNANGGKIGKSKSKTVSLKYGSNYSSLPKPLRDRQKFNGWYTAKKGGTKITDSTVFDKTTKTTLYARWTKQTSCPIYLNPNGGKVSKKKISAKYDKKLKNLPKPKRARYTFMGWYTKKRGGTEWKNGKMNRTQKSSVKLYARWAPKHFSQKDGRWANKRYIPTIWASGCGLTTMTMVVYALHGGSITPVKAANYSRRHGYMTSAPGKTRNAFFVKFPASYGIKSTQTNSGDLRRMSKAKAAVYHKKALNAVKKGNWVVAFMGPGNWTRVGHFILWYDIEGKRALVRDPNAFKASKTRNKISLLQSQAIRYWIIEVPDSKKIYKE